MGDDLEIVFGPMFSGKTSKLISTLEIYSSMGLNVLYCNSAKDTRTNEKFSSHNSAIAMSKKITQYKIENLANILELKEFKDIDVIGIDEAQFFSELVENVLDLVEKYGKKVVVAGLDLDINRKKMGGIIDLISHAAANKVHRLTTYCSNCWKIFKTVNRAIYSVLNPGYVKTTKNIVLPGGHKTYMAVCRHCYLNITGTPGVSPSSPMAVISSSKSKNKYIADTGKMADLTVSTNI
jgi:thymidine kinase